MNRKLKPYEEHRITIDIEVDRGPDKSVLGAGVLTGPAGPVVRFDRDCVAAYEEWLELKAAVDEAFVEYNRRLRR